MTGIILLVIYTVVMLAVTFKDRAKDSLAFTSDASDETAQRLCSCSRR